MPDKMNTVQCSCY